MSTYLKWSTTPVSNATQHGNIWVSNDPNTAYGPTSTTGFYAGIDAPSGGYTFYFYNGSTNYPYIYVANNDADAISIYNSLFNTSYTTIGQVQSAMASSGAFMEAGVSGDTTSLIFNISTSYTNSVFGFPTKFNGSSNYVVDWGDGATTNVVGSNITYLNHVYPNIGTYTITISGSVVAPITQMYNAGDIVSISQWGNVPFSTQGLYNFDRGEDGDVPPTAILASGAPTRDFTVTSYQMFMQYSLIDFDMSSFDTSGVTNMKSMFEGAENFNNGGSSGIGNWDVSNVTNMSSMFLNAFVFNQDIGDWDVSQVTDMTFMFRDSEEFNQDIGAWDVSSVTNMRSMFEYADNFNNGGSSGIGNWDVSSVTSMYAMFYDANSFNQDIGDWDVSNVTNMGYMFTYVSSFNQNLGSWDISGVTNMNSMFYGTNLSTENYSNTLIGWAAQTPKPNIFLNAYPSTYNAAGAAARQSLINNYNWSFSDGGPA